MLRSSYGVGRTPGANNDIVVRDAKHVSSRHLQVVCGDDGRVELKDLSTNGTYVNDVQVGKNQKVPLHDGDRVTLAKSGKKKKGPANQVFFFHAAGSSTAMQLLHALDADGAGGKPESRSGAVSDGSEPVGCTPAAPASVVNHQRKRKRARQMLTIEVDEDVVTRHEIEGVSASEAFENLSKRRPEIP